MSHNAPHETLEDLAKDVLFMGKTDNWSRSACVKFGMEHGQTWPQVHADLTAYFAEASLSEEQRTLLKDSPFV